MPKDVNELKEKSTTPHTVILREAFFEPQESGND